MRKLINALAICTVMAAGFTACNSAGSGEAYTIKMRLKPGDKFKQDISMNMSMTTTAMGMTKDVKMKMDMGADFDVLTGEGANKSLKITYTNMAMKMDMGVPGMNMDSMMNQQTKLLVGKSVTVNLNDSNVITSVSGFEQFLNDSLSETSKTYMEKMFSQDNMNSSFGMMFRMYPAKTVHIGDTWTATNNMEMGGMKMGVDLKYTLKSVKDGIATIDVDGTIKVNGGPSTEQVKMDMDMSGTQKGTMQLRMDDGYLVKGNYKADIKMEMTTMGQKIPMTMKADVDMVGK